MIITQDFAGNAKQVIGNPIVIVAMRDGMYYVTATVDGKLDAVYRPASTLEDVGKMLKTSFIDDRIKDSQS